MVNLEEINREVIAIMKQHYGDRLAKIVLFGSYARGDFDEESDVDFAIVITSDNVHPRIERRAYRLALTDLSLRYNKAISTLPVSAEAFYASENFLMDQIHQNSITIYG